MLIHGDVDDERTLEEEEALEGENDFENELDDLHKVIFHSLWVEYVILEWEMRTGVILKI